MNRRNQHSFVMIVVCVFLLCGCTHSPARFLSEFNVKMAGVDSRVTALNFNSRESTLIVGRESGEVEVWDVAKPMLLHVVKAHKLRADRVTLSEDGQYFFTNSGFDRQTKLWDRSTGTMLQTLSEARGPTLAAHIPSLYLVADGSRLRLFDLSARSFTKDDNKADGVILSLAVHRPTGVVAAGTASGTVNLWRTVAGNPTGQLIPTGQRDLYGMGNWVIALHFSEDGSKLYTVGRRGPIDVWDVVTMQRLRQIALPLRFNWAAAFSSDVAMAAVGGTFDGYGLEAGGVGLVDLRTGIVRMESNNTNLPAVSFLTGFDSLLFTQFGSAIVMPLQSPRN